MFDISNIASGAQLYRLWQFCTRVPGGRTAFSKLIGRLAPYTGTIDAQVLELRPGYSRIAMRDRKAVRNHLNSIHAVALINLAEVATGLAVMAGLPPDARGIIKGLQIEYLKKARGTLTATCECPIPDATERRDYRIEGVIQNRQGEVVARATAHWLIGPMKRKP